MEFVVAALIGIAAGALIVAVVGFAVGALRYVLTPPPPAGAGVCGGCTSLQALWNSMSRFEQWHAYLDFYAASLLCQAEGCPAIL